MSPTRVRASALAAVLALAGAGVATAQDAPPPPVAACTKDQAVTAGSDILTRAAKLKPSYYDDIAGGADWYLRSYICADLTRNGKTEMVVELECCTGGALNPWGIFRRGSDDAWHLAYIVVGDTNRGLRRAGKTAVRARVIARYDGADTSRFRDRVVRWDGRRFVSKLGKAYTRRPR